MHIDIDIFYPNRTMKAKKSTGFYQSLRKTNLKEINFIIKYNSPVIVLFSIFVPILFLIGCSAKYTIKPQSNLKSSYVLDNIEINDLRPEEEKSFNIKEFPLPIDTTLVISGPMCPEEEDFLRLGRGIDSILDSFFPDKKSSKVDVYHYKVMVFPGKTQRIIREVSIIPCFLGLILPQTSLLLKSISFGGITFFLLGAEVFPMVLREVQSSVEVELEADSTVVHSKGEYKKRVSFPASNQAEYKVEEDKVIYKGIKKDLLKNLLKSAEDSLLLNLRNELLLNGKK